MVKPTTNAKTLNMTNFSDISTTEDSAVGKNFSSSDPMTLAWIRTYFGPVGVFGIVFNLFTISIVARLGGNKSASGKINNKLVFDFP